MTTHDLMYVQLNNFAKKKKKKIFLVVFQKLQPPEIPAIQCVVVASVYQTSLSN